MTEPREESKKTTFQDLGISLPKPNLPTLPQVTISKKPTHTGVCPFKAVLLMFLVALPVSFVVGAAAHFVGIAVAFIGTWIAILPTLLISICGIVPWVFLLLAYGIILLIFVVYPFLVGMGNGALVGLFARIGLCRNPKAAGWAGLINGIALYAGHALMCFLVAGQMGIMTFTPAGLESALDLDLASGGMVLILILCVVEFALLMWGSYMGARGGVEGGTFCETHQAWYGKWVEGRYPESVIQQMALRLTNGVSMQPMEQIGDNSYPALKFGYRRCPGGNDCDVELKATLWWSEVVTDNKGNSETKTNYEEWFDALFPADVANAMIAELDLKPQDKKKKKKI